MKPEHVHLIGIGGTGMTALAGLLHASGCRVTGSDRALYAPTSTILSELGLEVAEGFDPAHLDPAPDLVVVGNAISRGNPELEAVLDRRLPYDSMPGTIERRFLPDRHSFVVAGTHGKTTTTSMMAWVLHEAGRDPAFLIGGLPKNFENPFRLGDGPFVIEGDEYDAAFFDKGPKFMHYRPDTALIGAVEFDHADIYRDEEAIITAFRRLVNLIPRRGLLVLCADCDKTMGLASEAPCRVATFGLERGELRADGYREEGLGGRFDVTRDGERLAEVSLSFGGLHNVRNALAVFAAALDEGIEPATIAAALTSFSGVRRRMEPRGTALGVTVLDDFAHHPTAIAATLASVRRGHRGGRVWAVLEPRSWSMRRSIFQDRLADAFDAADRVAIAPVFSMSQIPEGERLDTERLARELRERGGAAQAFASVDAVVEHLIEGLEPGDLVVVMTNGGFEGLHDRVLDGLRSREAASDRVPR